MLMTRRRNLTVIAMLLMAALLSGALGVIVTTVHGCLEHGINNIVADNGSAFPGNTVWEGTYS
jgi:hypothetical protein